MAKLTLDPAPTFFGEVPIPVAGKGEVKVKSECKHRTRDEFNAWLKTLTDKTDPEVIADMVRSWDFDDPFGPETVAKLLQSYIGSNKAIFEVYCDQLTKGRSGN